MAGMIAIVALFFFYLAYDMSMFIKEDEWFLVEVVAGIGLFPLAWAVLIWVRPPMNTARLKFRTGGFRLETIQLFKSREGLDLDWADVRAVTKQNGGLYGGRTIQIEHGLDGAVAQFALIWTSCSADEIINRLQASAKEAEFTFEKQTGGLSHLVKDRWVLSKMA